MWTSCLCWWSQHPPLAFSHQYAVQVHNTEPGVLCLPGCVQPTVVTHSLQLMTLLCLTLGIRKTETIGSF